MTKKKEKKEQPEIIVSRPVKFKDKEGRHMVTLDFENLFGFIPDRLIVKKVYGETNKFVFAVVPNEAQYKAYEALREKSKKMEN